MENAKITLFGCFLILIGFYTGYVISKYLDKICSVEVCEEDVGS